jgi:hypothetical protein
MAPDPALPTGAGGAGSYGQRAANPPGQSRIRYRLGTFDTFRRAMLDALPAHLPGWRENEEAPDHATALLEAWAYLADNASVYAELVANEAFVATATQRDSLHRLAELVGYRPGPGAAARVLVALTIDPARAGQVLTVPQGTRLGGRAAPDQLPVVFETDQAVQARAEHNRIPAAAAGRANQFAALSALAGIEAISGPRWPGPGGDLGAGDFNEIAADLGAVFPLFAAALLRTGTQPVPPPAPSDPPAPTDQVLPDPASAARRTVLFAGTGLRVRPGDHVLVFDRVGAGGAPSGEGMLRAVVAVEEDRGAHRTALTWAEDATVYATSPETTPAVYALPGSGLPFGAAAPEWAGLSTEAKARFGTDWDTGLGQWLPDDGRQLHLDTTVAGAAAGSAADPSFAVLLDVRGGRRHYRTFTVTACDQVTHRGFTLQAQVTRLTLGSLIPAATFLRRGTRVLLASRRLTPDDTRPLPEALAGDRLLLDGAHPDLVAGQAAVVTSTVPAEPGGGHGESVVSEAVSVASVRVLSPARLTLVGLAAPLGHLHRRSRTALLGNVVTASHGETVAREVLGSGDGTAWQAFPLRRGPLTYVADPEGTLRSTVQVSVNGVLWTEVGSLAAQDGPVFALEYPPAAPGTALVRFGAGRSRPPSGRDNVTARYRCGLGAPGDLPVGGLTRVVDAVPGLRAVVNPLAAEGAADPEGPEGIRRNAPASLRTLDRAVSVADHAELALTYPGIAQARASVVPAGGDTPGVAQEIRLTVARADRQPLSGDGVARLRRFLDARRDVNQPLRVVDFDPVPVDVTLVVDVDERYGRRTTPALVRAALAQRVGADGAPGYLARLGFGEAPRLSAVYAAAQAVPGVARVVVTRLAPVGVAPAVQDAVPVPATGLVVVADDPSDAAGLRGRLTVRLGAGGYPQ